MVHPGCDKLEKAHTGSEAPAQEGSRFFTRDSGSGKTISFSFTRFFIGCMISLRTFGGALLVTRIPASSTCFLYRACAVPVADLRLTSESWEIELKESSIL